MLHPGDWLRAALSNGPTTLMLFQSEAASTAAPVRVGEGVGPIECGREQQVPSLRARKMGDLVQVKPTPHRPLGPASSTALAQHSSVGGGVSALQDASSRKSGPGETRRPPLG